MRFATRRSALGVYATRPTLQLYWFSMYENRRPMATGRSSDLTMNTRVTVGEPIIANHYNCIASIFTGT